MKARPAGVALALVFAGLAGAQIPPSPGAASPATAASPAAVRNCDIANRRVATEQRALDSARDSIEGNQRSREGCTGKSACARYDQAIKAMEARSGRHDKRLTKFKTDAARLCKAG